MSGQNTPMWEDGNLSAFTVLLLDLNPLVAANPYIQ